MKKIKDHEITKVRIIPNNTFSLYETKDETVGQAKIVANDYFFQKADKNDVDVIIEDPPQQLPSPLDIVPILLAVAIALMVIRNQQQGPVQSIIGGGQSFETVDDTGVTFKNVAGIDEVKEEIYEIVEFLKNPQKFSDAGAKVPRGCLLSGQPGTGKTLLAKAIAGEAGVPFIATSASQFVELFVGMGASRIRSLFKQAREMKPCIIFIDEIDAIGKSRSGKLGIVGGNDEREQTLNQILLEMDGFNENDGIIVLAATNIPEILDSALVRPGRFDRKIEVELPDLEGRARILGVHSRNKQLDCGVDLNVIARATMGFSGADLANIMNEAAIMAARDDRTVIRTQDIDEAIEKTIIGLKRNVKVNDSTKRLVAYHEAGHALLGALLDGPETVRKVTITPRGKSGGVTIFFPSEPQDMQMVSREYLRNRIMIALGGTVAEEIVLGPDNVTTGASSDIQQVTAIATSMVKDYGFSDTFGKIKVNRDDSDVETEVRLIVDAAYKEAYSLIATYKDKLDDIAKALIQYETLDNKKFIEIIQ
jgi:cell division protease FtsH